MKTKQRPTVLIDASDIHRPSGGRTAVFELLRAMFAQEPSWRYIVLVSKHEPDFDLPHVRQVVIPFRSRPLERLWIQLAVSYFALFQGVDLVHFARTMGGFSRPARNVLTVFDLTTVVYPEVHARTAVWYWRLVAPLHLRWADRIIAISQHVADGLVRHFQLPPDKIEVVYCAPQSIFDEPASPQLLAQVRDKYQLPPQYLLFVGMLAKRKNLPTLIHALYLLKEQGIECPPLVLAGRRYRQSDDSAVLQQIRSLGLESAVRYLGPVGDDDLRGLYGNALALVFPSLHEGFGIPCLEAMKCRVPVVAARSGSLPEIVGDAGLLVDDPTDAQALARAIRQIVEDASLRQALLARGAARAAEFSWPASAKQVLDLYRQILKM